MPTAQEDDAAWAEVRLPVPPRALGEYFADPQLLLRLNPCLEFERLATDPQGRLDAAIRNESNGQRIETRIRVESRLDELVLAYSDGIKRETVLEAQTAPEGTRLMVTERYAPPPGMPVDPAVVDRSLVPWVAALRKQVLRDARFGWLPGYRWWSRRFWPGMPPRQRRVVWLLVWTTALEFLVFAAVLAIYSTAFNP